MSKDLSPSPAPAHAAVSAWAPFRHRTFAVIWVATVVSNIGGWMYSVASGWLMTSLDADPLFVSLVQVANNLPMFLFALPAGALVDIVDRRLFLIIGESAVTVTSAAFAVLVWLHLITPWSLLVFSFLVTVASAVTAPAWQAVVPQLVPKPELPAAVAVNSVGVNVSRAIGPALGGLTVGALGIAAPFWLNAICNVAVIVALIWWRTSKRPNTLLPAESFIQAIWTGLRYTRHNPHLHATLLRASGFFLFSSAFWALLPLVARSRIAGGPELYGTLLGVIGIGAVAGAFGLPAALERDDALQVHRLADLRGRGQHPVQEPFRLVEPPGALALGRELHQLADRHRDLCRIRRRGKRAHCSTSASSTL